jgi:hypothetical protein
LKTRNRLQANNGSKQMSFLPEPAKPTTDYTTPPSPRQDTAQATSNPPRGCRQERPHPIKFPNPNPPPIPTLPHLIHPTSYPPIPYPIPFKSPHLLSHYFCTQNTQPFRSPYTFCPPTCSYAQLRNLQIPESDDIEATCKKS